MVIVLIEGPAEVKYLEEHDENGRPVYLYYCGNNESVLLAFLFAYNNLLCLLALGIAFRIKNLPDNYHETKSIFLSLLSYSLVSLIFMICYIYSCEFQYLRYRLKGNFYDHPFPFICFNIAYYILPSNLC